MDRPPLSADIARTPKGAARVHDLLALSWRALRRGNRQMVWSLVLAPAVLAIFMIDEAQLIRFGQWLLALAS